MPVEHLVARLRRGAGPLRHLGREQVADALAAMEGEGLCYAVVAAAAAGRGGTGAAGWRAL